MTTSRVRIRLSILVMTIIGILILVGMLTDVFHVRTSHFLLHA